MNERFLKIFIFLFTLLGGLSLNTQLVFAETTSWQGCVYPPGSKNSDFVCNTYPTFEQCRSYLSTWTKVGGNVEKDCAQVQSGSDVQTIITDHGTQQTSTNLITGETTSGSTANSDKLGLVCVSFVSFNPSDCVALLGYYVFYIPASWILVLAGLVFNAFMAVSLSSKILGASFVGEIWHTILNISDIVFIFLLLYIAVRTILGLGDWKKEVEKIIVVALLINFSLFFTQVIVDASNITALAFYNRISTQEATINGHALISESTLGFKARGISEYFTDTVKPQTISGITNAHEWADKNKNNPDGIPSTANFFFIFLVTAVIVGFIAYAFFEVAFLMLGRVISFWFLMIFSPFAFIGFVLPKAAKITGAWTERVTNQALLAPVFLLFLYIIAFAVQSSIFNVDNLGAGNGDVVALLLQLILRTALLVGMLLLAVKTAKSMSDEFGNQLRDTMGKYIIGAAKGIAGMEGRAALNLTSKLGRATVGRHSQKVVDSGKLQAKMADPSRNAFLRFVDRQRFNVHKKVGDSNMDIRATNLGKTLIKSSGLKLGEARKGGFKTERDEQKNKDINYAKGLEVGEYDPLMEQKRNAERYKNQADKETATRKENLDEREEILAAKEQAYTDALDAYTDPKNAAIAPALKAKLDAAEAERDAAKGFRDVADAAHRAAQTTAQAAKATVTAANDAINTANSARRGAYANVVESRQSGGWHKVQIAMNATYSGPTARRTADAIRSGESTKSKATGDAAKDNQTMIDKLEEVAKALAAAAKKP